MSKKIKSGIAQQSLRNLGRDINVARRKRRIAVSDFAERVGVSERTIIRLEKGDPGVSLGTLSMALLVLGEIERISRLMEPSTDDTALLLDQSRLPVRIRKPKDSSNQENQSSREENDFSQSGRKGMGF